MMLALGPRQKLGDDPARGAIDGPSGPQCPPAGIEEEHRKAPEGDKLKAPLWELVIAGAALTTARAIGLGALPGDHLDFDGVRAGLGKLGLAVHKTLEMITAIQ